MGGPCDVKTQSQGVDEGGVTVSEGEMTWGRMGADEMDVKVKGDEEGVI